MIIQNSTDIKTELFYDSNGDIAPIDVQYEKQTINPNGLIQLQKIPTIHTNFDVKGKSGINVIRYNKADVILNETDFTVDYQNGILTFHSTQKGKEVQISYTNAIGRLSVSADRVFANLDSQGNVVKTLQKVIDDGSVALKGLDTLGGAVKVVQQTQANIDSIKGLTGSIIEGSNIKTSLDNSNTTARITDTVLKSSIGNATNKIQEMTEWVNKNGDVVNINNRVTTAEGKLNTVSASLAESNTIAIDFTTELSTLQNGGTLLLKKGWTYNLEGITIPYDNITIDGNGAKIIKTGNGKLFDISNRKNIKFNNCIFDFNGKNISTSYGIYGENVENIIIDNCNFKNGGFGVFLRNVEKLKITNSVFDTFTQWGNFITGNVNDVLISGNTSINSQYDGFKFGTETDKNYTMKNVIVVNNNAYNNVRDGLDIAFSGGENIIISNNNFHNNTEQGIDFKTIYTPNVSLKDCIIINNVIKENTIGINIQADTVAIENILIAGNNIIGFTDVDMNKVKGTGIRVFNGAKCKITNNNFNFGYFGIRLINSSECNVSNNIINFFYYNGIKIETISGVCNNNIVYKNRISGGYTGHANLILINDSSCSNNEVYHNDLKSINSAQYTSNDLGTSSMLYNNNVGSGTTPPTRGSVGEVFYVYPYASGGYEKMVCTVRGNPATWKGVGLIQT